MLVPNYVKSVLRLVRIAFIVKDGDLDKPECEPICKGKNIIKQEFYLTL